MADNRYIEGIDIMLKELCLLFVSVIDFGVRRLDVMLRCHYGTTTY